jgi:3-hydroxyacyl-[acyl-carrier-protein] dehydratase
MAVTTSTTPVETRSIGADGAVLEVRDIERILPHRYPFLLIDRIIEMVPRERVVAIKNVSINEPYFQGHFPEFPIMPGVLVIEAMAQAGGLLLLTELPDYKDKLLLFTGVERAKFRKPVVPGDQLRLEVSVLAFRRTAARLNGEAYVGQKLACEATLSCQIIDRPPESLGK